MRPTPVSAAEPRWPPGPRVPAEHRPPPMPQTGSQTRGIARTAQLAGLTRPCLLPVEMDECFPYGETLNRRAGTSPGPPADGRLRPGRLRALVLRAVAPLLP